MKTLVKGALTRIGIEPHRVGRILSSFLPDQTPSGARLLGERSRRRAYVEREVLAFNPNLVLEKAPGVTRIATVWEANGRLSWLDHANHGGACELIHLPRRVFDPVWRHCLSGYLKRMGAQLGFGEYSLDLYFNNIYSDGRKAFTDYCADVVDQLQSTFGIDVFFLPKVNDDWTLDYLGALSNCRVPAVIDDRESAISAMRLERVPPKLEGRLDFAFNRLFVHNDLHHELFRRSGLPVGKLVVNGSPSTDFWFRPDLWQTRSGIHQALRDDRILVLYFSFGPRTYMNFYYGEEQRDWTELCGSYHKVLLHLLVHHGDRVQIVYKFGGKPARDLYSGYDDFQRCAAPHITEQNFIELNAKYSSLDLINNADVILGFQTSGMIEGMFTNKPIVYGAWGELYEEIKETLLPLHRCKALTFADSPKRLVESMEAAIAGDGANVVDEYERAARSSFREKYFARADGEVSKRILDYSMSLSRRD